MATSERTSAQFAARARLALYVVITCFAVIVIRLWFLQIVRGEYFRTRSEENRLRTVYLPATRGVIYDRNGEVLARSRPSFNVELIVEDAPDPIASVGHLAEILKLDAAQLLDRSRQQSRRRRFEPRILLRDVSREVVAQVMARKSELPGIIVNVSPARDYVHGDTAAHVLGYIREITKSQLESSKYAGYMPGDMVGQYGLEAKWEHFLQGRRGVQLVVVNAGGNRIGEYSYEPELTGNSINLTLDYRVQKAADDALKNVRGAIVALDPNTGEILAMSSSPRFDPNMFTGELDPEAWRDLISGSGRKLQNRVVQGSYPPGSVFKAFMAVAGLAEGIVSSNNTVSCPGYLPFGGRSFRCHKASGHGVTDLRKALIESCDIYFYQLGIRLGVDRIHDYATRFGLGRLSGLELVQEEKGLVPSTEWKRTFFRDPANQKWFPGETLSVAIGQGAVTTTPLQIAVAMSALVNGGKVMRPFLVKSIESSDGSFRDDDFQPHIVSNVEVDNSILEQVKQDLVGVVNDAGGTGRRSRLDKTPEIIVGGKTGTAQVVALEAMGKHESRNHHAWFSAFAPADNPKIVVTVLAENGGHGGATAAPLAKQVMEAFFSPETTFVTDAKPAGAVPAQAPTEEMSD